MSINDSAASNFLNQLQASVGAEPITESEDKARQPVQAVESFDSLLTADSAESVGALSLEDVLPEDDEPQRDIKSTNAFRVKFLREVKGKMKSISGSKEALEVLFSVNFAIDRGPAVEADSDAPKKRGRKPKKAKATEGTPRILRMVFLDDVKNDASRFMETLFTRSDFQVEIQALDEDEVAVEEYTFTDCNLKPTTEAIHFSYLGEGTPKKLMFNIEYGSVTRTSIEQSTDE